MTSEQLPNISVIDPIGTAVERVKVLLFRPFDLEKWFTIGFCAWLAQLGQGGGFNFQFPSQRRQFNYQPQQLLHQARDFCVENLFWIIPAVIIWAVLLMAIGVVLLWLSCRGRFMFLHCVAQNKAEVKIPWYKFGRQGNSLFWFQFVAGIILLVFVLLSGVLTFLLTQLSGINKIIAIIPLIFIFLIVVVIFAVLIKFVNDFVVPIMYLRGYTWLEGWREFWLLLTGNKGKFTLYILFQIVIAAVIGAIIFTAVLLTCCCAACFLAIPYIATVLLLPVLVFKRAYSLYYLRQFGQNFDCFIPEIITVA